MLPSSEQPLNRVQRQKRFQVRQPSRQKLLLAPRHRQLSAHANVKVMKLLHSLMERCLIHHEVHESISIPTEYQI